MSATTPLSPYAMAPAAATPYRMTADEFDRIADGLDKRAELVDGRLVERPDRNPEHALVTLLLRRLLDRILGESEAWHARDDKPVRIDDFNERLPDVAVVPGSPLVYRNRHPRPTDAAILIEVSWSTFYADRGEKHKLYASRGVPVYWIVNIKDRQVEVYTEPTHDGYISRTDYKDGGEVPVMVENKEIGRIAVTEILPPIEPAASDHGA